MRLLIALMGVAMIGEATATEEPDYDVIAEFEAFELRRYASYTVAETIVAGKFDEVGNAAFGILFDYISGGNQGQEEIAMTAPVTQQASGEASDYHVAFVMPESHTLATLPRPDDERVQLKSMPARFVAAHRYSGNWSQARYREHLQTLRAAIDEHGLEAVAPPVFARYNAPFTPWFLRRNEILIEVADPGTT